MSLVSLAPRAGGDAPFDSSSAMFSSAASDEQHSPMTRTFPPPSSAGSRRMSRRHLSFLAMGAVAVVLAVLLLVPTRTGQDPGEAAPALLPGLEAGINATDRLVVRTAGPKTIATLVRSASGWQVAELAGYPADFDTLRPVLAALAQARVIETKTANPDYFDRLGVQDLEQQGAPGTLLELTAGDETRGILMGNTATNRKGRYARRTEGGPALLTGFDAEIPATLMGWVDDTIVDLSSEETARVDILHADGATLSVARKSADETDFTLGESLPEGRSLQSSWTVNSLGGVLAGLRFEAVRPSEEFDWTAPLRVTALAFSGLELRLDIVARADEEGVQQHWARLVASAPYAGQDPDAESAAAIQSEAERLNGQAGGWAYRLTPYQFDAMNKRVEDLLAPPEDAAAAAVTE